jgi:transposase
MSKVLKYAIGMDISKDKFDACLAMIDDAQKVTIKSQKSSISNSMKGFSELTEWVKKHCVLEVPIRFCLEATGIYHEHLAWYLHHQGSSVSVLVPNKSRHYMKSLGMKSKDDKIDAKGLATMAAQQQLKLWQPISDQIYELRQLTRFYQQLQESRTTHRNQLQACLSSRMENDHVANGLRNLIDLEEQQIRQMATLIEESLRKDPVLWEKIENINSVKGLGIISIATVVAETDGFVLFENLSQLVNYCGYDVIKNKSGKRIGKTKISKKGNNRIRRILFMPALSVVMHNVGPFINLYNRVYERTRIKMKAYVAVQRKLLILIYTLWKRHEKFKPEMYPEMGLGCSLSVIHK